MSRSQPIDKFTMVTGLMQLQHIVAVTGDGANDASALSKSNVGFAMGIAGTQAAKEACDIVILDDNFTSIVKAVLWGRNVFDSIRKFLQFQLSVNVVAVVITFLSSVVSESSQSSLTAVQLLWVNMIMDSLGALALATDLPTEKLLDRKPYHRNERIINNRMLVQVGIMGGFQTIVLCLLLYAGQFFLPCDTVLQSYNGIALPEASLYEPAYTGIAWTNWMCQENGHVQTNDWIAGFSPSISTATRMLSETATEGALYNRLDW